MTHDASDTVTRVASAIAEFVNVAGHLLLVEEPSGAIARDSLSRALRDLVDELQPTDPSKLVGPREMDLPRASSLASTLRDELADPSSRLELPELRARFREIVVALGVPGEELEESFANPRPRPRR